MSSDFMPPVRKVRVDKTTSHLYAPSTGIPSGAQERLSRKTTMQRMDPELRRDGERWTEEEITLALALYYVTPYSKISPKNPQIIELAAELGRRPGSVSMKLSNLAFCDPAVIASGRKGSANGSKLDHLVWERYNAAGDTERLADSAREIASNLGIRLGDWFVPTNDPETPVAIAPQEEPNFDAFQVTERERIVRARVGQSFFRRAVLAKMNGRCAVTGTPLTSLLDAAHILPWRAYPDLRRNVRNGLMLTKTLHAAFDENLMGITPDAQIVISDRWLEQCGTDREQKYLSSLHRSSVNLGYSFPVAQEFLDERYTLFLNSN